MSNPRFHAVAAGELERLEYSVDVLGETEEIDSPEKLDVKRYGVVVSRGHKRGLLLPDLEGVDTVEEQIGGLLKAGFCLTHLYEDTNGEGNLHEHGIPTFLAVRAEKET